MNPNLAQRVQTGFPTGMVFPDLLSKLCDWDETEIQDRTISGYFELHENGRDFFHRLIDDEQTRDQFGIFGTSGDGSLYCLWSRDDAAQAVVYISKNRAAYLLATDIEEFLRLLAVGYDEIVGPDLSSPPEALEHVNPKFQVWVAQTLQVSIPTTGQAIVDQAVNTHGDINAWLSARCSW